jgi:hypothetical protein
MLAWATQLDRALEVLPTQPRGVIASIITAIMRARWLKAMPAMMELLANVYAESPKPDSEAI